MGDRLGQQIGNYRLVKLLGKGGFAEVYLGQHVRLASKQAAIKILHLTDVDVRKFQEEAETTERLVHPHIVRLLDFDLQEGTPFLVLDFAPGGSLRTRHPKGSIVPLATVGEYLKELAPALQYAHDNHILHRDIKPDNMLIGRQGELLLSDFGIAVLSQTGRTSLEASYGIGGTPYYMAPEAYRGKPEKASDQYALAVVVYEWLCGSVPFSEGNFIQLGYQHSHEPLPPLRERNPTIPSDVEAVIMKALSKEPKDRFASVQDFAKALEEACKQPPMGTRLYIYRGHSDKVLAIAWSPDSSRIASTGIDETVQVWDAFNGDKIFAAYPVMGTSVTWSLNKACIAFGDYDFPKQQILAARENSAKIFIEHAIVQVWDIIADKDIFTYRHRELVGLCWDLAWSPDGKHIAAVTHGGVSVWDATSGNIITVYKVHQAWTSALAWLDNGGHIASGGSDGKVYIWSLPDGITVLAYEGHSAPINDIAISPDTKRIASASHDQTVQVWDILTGKPALIYRGHSDAVHAVAWSPDSNLVASASNDRTVQIWDAINGNTIFSYIGHSNWVHAIAWSPNGRYIATASHDKTVQVWQAP